MLPLLDMTEQELAQRLNECPCKDVRIPAICHCVTQLKLSHLCFEVQNIFVFLLLNAY